MSARGQATLEDVGLRQKRFSATTETDGYLDDFIQKLENEIGVKTTTKVEVNDKQIRKFFRNAIVSFVGQTEDEEPPTKKRRRMSQKESVFKNETKVPVDFTFCKKAETVTTAQLRTRSGFKIGVLALAGGGLGGQGGLGVSAGYSRETERMNQSSQISGREMHAVVRVAPGTSVKAIETDNSVEYNAECEFDIAIPGSFEIPYLDTTKQKEEKIEASKLRTSDDPESSEEEYTSAVLKQPKTRKIVHLRRTFQCKLVNIEHDLTIRPYEHKSEKTEKAEDQGNRKEASEHEVEKTTSAEEGTELERGETSENKTRPEQVENNSEDGGNKSPVRLSSEYSDV